MNYVLCIKPSYPICCVDKFNNWIIKLSYLTRNWKIDEKMKLSTKYIALCCSNWVWNMMFVYIIVFSQSFVNKIKDSTWPCLSATLIPLRELVGKAVVLVNRASKSFDFEPKILTIVEAISLFPDMAEIKSSVIGCGKELRFASSHCFKRSALSAIEYSYAKMMCMLDLLKREYCEWILIFSNEFQKFKS